MDLDTTNGGLDAMTRDSAEQPRLAEVDALARDALKARMFGGSRKVRRLGRYRMTGVLGEGGMGVVYSAHDDQLERSVAVKLIRAGLHDENARTRLLREAQGLARLSHPNVVQIHEVGEHEGSIFVAMELVEGVTLRDWIEKARHDGLGWKSVLRRVCEAGRGLQAAHDARLVHRDFKPENAIVGDDGRVRVLDFGLVRGVDESLDSTRLSSTTSPGEEKAISQGALDRSLTMVGTMLGTPAYMAPEQIQRGVADAAADQFAFCVVCFEALYAKRPFDGRTSSQLHANVLAGRYVRPNSHSGVPRKVLEVIERGLAVKPEQRWADMATLLDALERQLAPPTTTRFMMLGAGTLAIGVTLGAVALRSDSPTPCQIDDAALAGVWDPSNRQQLKEAFANSSLSLTTSSAIHVDERLDQWANGWVEAQRQACEDTRITGAATDQQLEQRTQCLDQRRRRFGAVVDVLAEGTPAALGNAARVLDALPELDTCNDPHERTSTPSAHAEVELARGRLARGKVLLIAGVLDEVERIATEVEDVATVHAQASLVLDAKGLAAQARLRAGAVNEGANALLSVIREAEEERFDELVAELRVALAIAVVGVWSKPHLEASLVDEAEAWSKRLGHGDKVRARDLLRARIELDLASGNTQRARERLAQQPEADDETQRILDAVLEGRVLAAWGQHDKAFARFEDALHDARRVWGEGSWLVAAAEHNVGLSALERGEIEIAAEHLEHAQSHYRAILGPNAFDVARVRFVRAKLDLDTGKIERAARSLEPLLDVYRRRLGPRHAQTGEVLNALGIVRFYTGDYAHSVLAYQEALDIARTARGELHAEVGLLYSNLGESLAAQGQHDAAITSYRRASEIFAVTLDAQDDLHALVLKGHAESLIATLQTTAAIPMLERALELYGTGETLPYERADVHRSLALALASTKGSRAEARRHARLSAKFFEQLDMTEELAPLRPLL